MPDMLVKLYDIPELPENSLQNAGIILRRPLIVEKQVILNWVEAHFSRKWATECGVTFSRVPISTFIAVQNGNLIGFASYHAACINFFGPTGVLDSARGIGVGRQLLLSALHAMKWEGYAYAIIGGVGPASFYKDTVGAVTIEDSTPGIYKDLLC